MELGVKSINSLVATSARHSPESGISYPPFSLTPKKTQAGKSYYGVRIVNGEMAGAGTTGADVFVTLVGSKGSTGKVSIYSYLFHSFSGVASGTCDDLIVEVEEPLGDVHVVLLGIDGGNWALDSTWFVNYTVVKDLSTEVETHFPCYLWIGKNKVVSLTSNTATLKDVKDNEILKEERKKQLEQTKKQYRWQMLPDTGLPSAIDDTVDDLPLDQEFGRVKNFDFTSEAVGSAVAIGLEAVLNSIDDLDDYKTLTKHLDKTGLPLEQAGRWTSDVEFGRQILNGINPVIIRRCTEIPSKFPVTNEMLQPFLVRGMSLQEEMEAGNVYICDLAVMDGLPTRDGQFVAAPICLLYVNGCKQLVPIAIQLKQGVREEEKGKPNPIFLPSDGWIDWLLAKIHYQSSHGQQHQISTHYFSCHAAMEAYTMATLRNLPRAHPVHKLLLPHFRYTMAINSRARRSLINDGGAIDRGFGIGGQGRVQLFQRTSESYSVDWTNIKKYVKTRGVDDPDKLPGYYYRDDGLKIFDAFEGYVRDVVDAYYASNEDVTSDPELQDWANDIHTNAFPSYFGGKQGRDFPEKITSKEQLIERCTVIMFTGSAQHASINFGQFQIYGYIPQAPLTLRQPPPTEKGVADYQALMDTLPDRKASVLTLILVHLLSQYSKDEVFIGNYPYKLFTEAKILSSIENLRKRLEEIAEEIKARNEGLDVPYTYMLPKGIPNSITI